MLEKVFSEGEKFLAAKFNAANFNAKKLSCGENSGDEISSGKIGLVKSQKLNFLAKIIKINFFPFPANFQRLASNTVRVLSDFLISQL